MPCPLFPDHLRLLFFFSQGNIFAGFALKTSDSSVPKPPLSTGVTLNFGSNLTFQPKSNGAAQKQTGANNGDSTENPEYVRQLKVLNENILSWIQKHVRENPYCILTPSFKDYEKHLSDLERKYNIQDTKTSQDKGASAAPAVQPAAGLPELTPSMSGTGGKAPGDGFSFSQSSAEAASKSHTASDTSDTKGVWVLGQGQGSGRDRINSCMWCLVVWVCFIWRQGDTGVTCLV